MKNMYSRYSIEIKLYDCYEDRIWTQNMKSQSLSITSSPYSLKKKQSHFSLKKWRILVLTTMKKLTMFELGVTLLYQHCLFLLGRKVSNTSNIRAIVSNSNWLTLIVSDCLTFTKLYPIISGTGTPVFDVCIWF